MGDAGTSLKRAIQRVSRTPGSSSLLRTKVPPLHALTCEKLLGIHAILPTKNHFNGDNLKADLSSQQPRWEGVFPLFQKIILYICVNTRLCSEKAKSKAQEEDTLKDKTRTGLSSNSCIPRKWNPEKILPCFRVHLHTF